MIELDGIKIDVTRFPDTTTQVWNLSEELLSPEFVATIRWTFESESEIISLAQLKALLDNAGRKIYLILEYLPYARQDKKVSNDATFALYPFATLLNSLGFDKITILDPHSPVALELIKNSQAIYPIEEVNQIILEDKIDILCFPDKGAQEKYSNIHLGTPNVFANKVREQSTGKILETKIEGSAIGKRVLIVDDICDGGATFTALAKVLKEAGATYVGLQVTHGIFSKGIQVLLDSGIDKVSFTHRQGEIK